MKDVTTMASSAHSHDRTIYHEELWESKHVLNTTWSTHHILDSHYEKTDLRKVASKTLTDDKRSVLHNMLSNY